MTHPDLAFNPSGDERRMVFRVAGTEAVGRGLPLVVRSVGHYRVGPVFRENIGEPKWFTELYWTIAGGGTFQVGETSHRVRAGDIFIYRPGEVHRLAAGKEGWNYRWITFDGRETLPLFGMFDLPRRGPAGFCPEAAFDRVEAALRTPTRKGVRAASVAAYEILETAGRRPLRADTGDAATAEAIRLHLDEAYPDPDTGVETAAAILGRHRTTILRAFVAAHGVTPSTYLARRRLQHALSLLRTTTLPVAEIATSAGFRSPEYLARVVRTETGLSPRAFRHGNRGESSNGS